MRPKRGTYREFHAIKAHPEPADLSLYRQLLPSLFEMPDVPALMVFVADYVNILTPLMHSYREAGISLWSVYKGVPGWYILTLPLNSRVGLWIGLPVGFPKYLVRDIRLTQDEQGWHGQVKRAGETWLSLEFRPGITRPLAAWENESLQAATFFHGDSYTLVPPGKGPKVNRISFLNPIPSALPPVPGTACAAVDPGAPWAALANWDAPAPAAYCHFVGGISIVVQQGI